jgi:hypothetical protein
MVRRIFILLLAAAFFVPPSHAAQKKTWWEIILGEPGSGIHVIPDPRPPVPHNPPPSNPPLPPTFGTTVHNFMKFVDAVHAMKNWYTALTPAEQADYQPQYQATMAKLAAAENELAQLIIGPLVAGNEVTLYGFFDMVRKMDPIRARMVFLGVLDVLAKRINMDYAEDPANAIKARRARDVVAMRSWVGRQ